MKRHNADSEDAHINRDNFICCNSCGLRLELHDYLHTSELIADETFERNREMGSDGEMRGEYDRI